MNKKQNVVRSLGLRFGILLFAILTASLVTVSCKSEKEASKEDIARFVRSAEAYMTQGQFRAAMLEAKNAIQANPNDSQGYKVLAEIYNSLGAFVATQTLLEQNVKKMPELGLLLAESYVETRKYRSALNLLAELKFSGDLSDESFLKAILTARCYIYLGDKDSFEKSLTYLNTFEGKKNSVKLVESEALIAQGKPELAKSLLEQVQQPDKNDEVKLLIDLGNIALQENELLKAEDSYTKALGYLPKTDLITAQRLLVLGQLTEALMRQGKSGEAYRYQKIIADANPEGNTAKEKFNDAMEFFRQGKFSDAEKLLKELREQFPQDKNSAILLGLVEYQKGQDKQAIDLFDQYIDPETTASSVIQAAAVAKFRANKMDDAIALLKKSVDSQPDNAEILATYGLALLDLDKTSAEGQKAVEKSLALNPKQQRLRLALAKRDFEMKNPELGLSQLQKAYKEQPFDLVIQQSYFKALFSQGKLDTIKAEIASFQKRNPDSARGHFVEGWFNLVQKKYAEAEQSFKKSLDAKDNSEKTLSYAGLAEVYKLQGQPLKAGSILESMLESNSAQANLYAEWLGIMQKADRIDQAMSFLRKLESKTENWMPSVVMAQLLVMQGQESLALKHVDIAIERNQKSEQVKKIAAIVYQQNGIKLAAEKKSAEAKSQLLKALAFDPDNINILANLINLEISEKNIIEAQKLLDQYTLANSANAERDYLQGVISSAENKPEEALKSYLASWAKKPLEPTALAIVAHYKKANESEKLFSFVKVWSEKIPSSPQAVLGMAIDSQEKNDKASAIKWYEKYIALDVSNAAVFNNLAWLYYEVKNPKAVDTAEMAYKLNAKNAAIIDTYGWILVESGRVNEGLVLLENAASLAPTNTEIQGHLIEAKKRVKK